MYETSRRDPLPIRVPAATAILTAAEFDDLPFGGWAGERIIPAKYEPAPPPPEPLRIEPPEWAGQEGDPTLAGRDPEQLPDALAVLKAEADDVYWPELLGPPLVDEPLHPVAIPPADWQAEEAARERVRSLEGQEKLEPPRPKPQRFGEGGGALSAPPLVPRWCFR